MAQMPSEDTICIAASNLAATTLAIRVEWLQRDRNKIDMTAEAERALRNMIDAVRAVYGGQVQER